MPTLWGILETPRKGRTEKPRSTGVTMVIDKGLGVAEMQSLLSLNAPWTDFFKLTFGTAALYPESVLREKISVAAAHDIWIYPGGTFFEIAVWQGKVQSYFQKVVDLGFIWVEISDGTIELPVSERIKAIRMAHDFGLRVITEIGKKRVGDDPEEEWLCNIAELDFREGALWVIMEGRESGEGVGIFDAEGKIKEMKFQHLKENLPIEKIIWEAPQKAQQARLINEFGSNVNLGNIPASELMALEALRLGIRSDTWPLK